MPLFFVLSGLGIYFKYLNNQSIEFFNELKNISKKLLIPYSVWSFIYLIGTSLSASFIKKKPLIPAILERGYAFVSLRGAAPLWFLAALFLVNVVFVWILSKKLFKEKPIFCHSIIIFFSILGTLFAQQWFFINKPLLSKIYLYPIIAIFRFLPSLFYLEIGYLFGIIFEKLLASKLIAKLFYFILCTLSFVGIKLNISCGMNMHTFDYNNVCYVLILGILGSLCLIIFCCLLPEKLNILSNIVKNSMDIMILHYPPMPTLRIICILFIKLHLGLCFCSITILTTFLCLMMSKYILKPIRNKIYR